MVIGLQGGARGELDLGLLLPRRLTITASTLRARTVEERAPLARRLVDDVWPGFADGSLRPVIAARYALEDVAEAHRLVESSAHIGKVLLVP